MAINLNIKQVEVKALDILTEIYGNLDNIVPPININKILEKYDLTLKVGQFTNPDISGVYDKNEKSIYVSGQEPYPRQVFTIAHELGHFFLDGDKDEDIYYRADALNMDKEEEDDEIDANAFAASLLMPEFLVRRLWPQIKNSEALAQAFGVSNSACYYRLKNLNLID